MRSAALRVTAGAPNWRGDPKKGFATPGEFLLAILARKAAVDERLRYLASAGSDEAGEYADPYGGFLMPEGLAPLVLRVPPELDPMAAVTEVPMGFPRVRVPARTDKNHATTITGGLRVLRHVETTEAVASRGELEQIMLNSDELIGATFATNLVVDGSAPLLAQWLEAAFRDALTDTLREERVRGTGVGEGLGVLNSPALITIAKETGQVAGTVVAPNALRMAARVWGFDEGAVWIANPMLRTQLPLLVDLAAGQPGKPLYVFASADGEHDRLCGRPVFYDERASAPGAVGDLMVVRWSEYLSGIYRRPELASSVHVRLLQGETMFRFYLRGDSAPWWRSALAPRYGTDTLSPYVTLAART